MNRTIFGAVFLALFLFTSTAHAGPPLHQRTPGLDIGGLNRACGTAVDSKGDVYVASAGESKVKVFNPAHTELTSIANANEPCGLAVNGKGELFVSEQATGNVVRYKPNAYPFAGTPTYGAAEPIDSSGEAKSISVDPYDDFLYVAAGDRIDAYNPAGTLGIDEVQRVQVSSSVTGTYKLKFQGQETGSIASDASHAQVQTALEGLSTIGAGNVAVSAGKFGDEDHRIAFQGALGGADLELLQADDSNLVNGSANISVEVNGFSGHIGAGALGNATGVAAYTHVFRVGELGGEIDNEQATRYLYAADAATDRVEVFSGEVRDPEKGTIANLKLRDPIEGPAEGEDFGFGSAGAQLAIDPGNPLTLSPVFGEPNRKICVPVAEQACTAGHLLVYDDGNAAVEEFEATGRFLDRLTAPGLADAKPSAIAIDRSGGSGDGTIYVGSGSGAGAKLLAFGPLAAPSRAPAPALSHVLPQAAAVATDSFGNVYVVADPLIHVYRPDGTEIKVEADGKGIKDPDSPVDLAVDSAGNVYVVDVFESHSHEAEVTYYAPSQYPPVDGTTYARHEPSIATPVDFGGGEAVAVAVNPVNDHLFATARPQTHEYDSAKNGSGLLKKEFAKGVVSGFRDSIGVNADGSVYFGSPVPREISVIDADGTEALSRITGLFGGPKGPIGTNPNIAVDRSNGHALVVADEAGTFSPREYDASGAFVAEFGQFTGGVSSPRRMAVDNACALHDPPLSESTSPTCAEFDPANGTVYVAFDDPKPGTFDVTAFAPLAYGETPLAATGTAGGLGGGGVTLSGTVNPRGFDLTGCRFEYLADAQYLSNGKTFAGAATAPCTETLAQIGRGNAPVAVHGALSGLDPEGRYRFRLIAENKYGPSEGEAGLFGPPTIATKPALPVLHTEATLRADVDPSGLETTYRFEYGKAAGEYDHSTPLGKLAPGDGPVAISAPLIDLAEGTAYHFRIVVENEAEAVEGPDQTFTTLQRAASQSCPNTEYRTGLSANLPDCRAYELVTPAETGGLTPAAVGSPTSLAMFNTWLVTPRGPLAGERLSYFTFGTLPGFNGNGLTDGYRAQRGAGDHPEAGWTNTLFGPTYEQSSPDVLNIPVQQSVASDQLYSFWQINSTEVLPGTLPQGRYLRTPAGFEPVGQGTLGTDLKAESRYLTPGGAHVIFHSSAHLQDNAPPALTQAVYDRAAGSSAAHVVSLLPGEVTPTEAASYVAATEDGSAIAFEVGGALYLRRDNAETVQVAAGNNTFAGFSADGDRVFFTTELISELPATIYACDVEAGPCAGPGAHPPTEIAEDSVFVSVSPDGSRVLFTSKAALTGAEANENGEVADAGENNLYVWDAETGATGFVSGLDPADFVSFRGDVAVRLNSWARTVASGTSIGRLDSPTRSTPDGAVFAFQSHARLTDYDNGGNSEIYRYQPGAGPGERLLCVSCDPTDAPPSGDATLAFDGNGIDPHGGVYRTTLIASLTDDGQQVFFESPDRLVPEDANGAFDVYQWKAKGAGGCKAAGGCLALISSGQGESNSYLYGMSADGHDVFFRSREKLVGQDIPGSPSIYDARVGGGIPDPSALAPCQGDACQGSGTTPPPLPAPTSTGAGEAPTRSGAKPRCPKGKRKVRRAGKTRCVKRSPAKRHAKQAKRHRANADKGARR